MTTHKTLAGEHPAGDSIRLLAVLEARRSLRRASLWIGCALTIVLLSTGSNSDWAGGEYINHVPTAFVPIVLATFIVAFQTGRRDNDQDASQSAPVGASDRSLARLGCIALPLLMTALMLVVFAIVSRSGDGYWNGDRAGHVVGSDTVTHSITELLQVPLIVMFVGAGGIALGRSRSRAALPGFIAALPLVFLLFGGYWIFNIPPAHLVTPVQTQPLFIDLDDEIVAAQIPADWYIEGDPGETPKRLLVHQPTILGHHLYLIGLITLAVGLALREDRGRRLVLAGTGVAIAGVIMQLLVSPL